MIKKFPATRVKHHYIVDPDGHIYYSTVTKEISVFGVDIIGTCMLDYTHPDETLLLQNKLSLTIQKGYEAGVFQAKDRLFLMIFKKISSMRIRIDRYDITGMGSEIFDIVKGVK